MRFLEIAVEFDLLQSALAGVNGKGSFTGDSISCFLGCPGQSNVSALKEKVHTLCHLVTSLSGIQARDIKTQLGMYERRQQRLTGNRLNIAERCPCSPAIKSFKSNHFCFFSFHLMNPIPAHIPVRAAY